MVNHLQNCVCVCERESGESSSKLCACVRERVVVYLFSCPVLSSLFLTLGLTTIPYMEDICFGIA
jgi:hypothetical protein